MKNITKRVLSCICAMAMMNGAGAMQIYAVEPTLSESAVVTASATTTADEYVAGAQDCVLVDVYDASTKVNHFNMNGRTYYQGLVFGNYSGANSPWNGGSTTSSVVFNTENINEFSCTIGHIDNTWNLNAKVSIYLDDVIEEEFNVSPTMPLKNFSIDVSKAKQMKIIVVREYTDQDRSHCTWIGFADICIDNEITNRKCVIPSYDTPEDFISTAYDVSNASIYDGKSKAISYNMNGRTYYQGIAFKGGSSSRIAFNTENIDTFSCTLGHIDNTARDSATIKVYLDNQLYETFDLTHNMPLKDYTLDVSETKNVLFTIDRKSEAGYAFADISIDGKQSIRPCTVPVYKTSEEFMASAYNSDYYKVYDGKSKVNYYRANGRTYYQGIVLNAGSTWSRLAFNTENVSQFACTLGHIDNTTNTKAKVSVYLDDLLYETLNVGGSQIPELYTLDVSDTKNVVFYIEKDSNAQFCFADVQVDNNSPVRKGEIPEYADGTAFIQDGYTKVNMTVYDGKSKAITFAMNDTPYNQGMVFKDGTESRCTFNVENIDNFSCKLGHIDGSAEDAGRIDVYLDNILEEQIDLQADMDISDYTLDTSKASTLGFYVVRNSQSQYAMADVQVTASAKKATLPEPSAVNIEPTEPTTEPTEPTTQPTEPTTEPTTQPTTPTTEPTEPTTQPTVPTTEPTETTTQPTSPTNEPTEPTTKPDDEPKYVIFGDLNFDDEVDILDVITANKYILGIGGLNKNAVKRADVNLDGNVDASDALIILKYALQMIDSLPVLS